MCFFSSTKGKDKKNNKKKNNVYSHAMTNMHGIFCIKKKKRMQIKHNVYFKNPKFAEEVTHSESFIGKQETRVKFDFFFFLISEKNFFSRVQIGIDH